MLTTLSHTLWQVAQIPTSQTKTCQRVCLPNARADRNNVAN
jgi:hypothetical protein